MHELDRPTAEPTTPTYAGAFRCIGPECEDHCCGDWNIPLDEATYASYQTFPADRLGSTVQEYVFRNAPGSPPGLYANIYRKPSGLCPFLNAERLCQIQQTYGSKMLSASCSIYPRSLSLTGGELEGSLSMSCPEAARQVLLDAAFLSVQANLHDGSFRTDNVFYPARDGGLLHPVRTLLIDMVRDRSRTIQDRLLLIGLFAQHLDQAPDDAAVHTLITRYREILEKGSLRAELAALAGSPGLRLELVLALSNECLADPDCSPRFRDSFWAFVEGIGSPAGSAPGDDLSRLFDAAEHVYQPFMAGSPFILENYLINHILQHLFPFGRSGSTRFETRSCSAEWVLLALQFAWMETLLIGVAARQQHLFGTADIIRTVQSFTRATEHDPEILRRGLLHIAERKLNTPEGMAALLRL